MALVLLNTLKELLSDTHQFPPWVLLIIIAISLCFIFILYQSLLPRPIPGIPHHAATTSSLLGDIPSLLREVTQTDDLTGWLGKQIETLNSPLIQVFIRPPLGKPFVLLADFRETRDIMTTRRKEFDRSKTVSVLVSGPIPHHHFMLPTGSEWRAHRRLLQDLMTPSFLSRVAAPSIYDVVLDTVDLWTRKGKVAAGRPFSAQLDLYYTSLDAVLAFSFGKSFAYKAVRPQISDIDDSLICLSESGSERQDINGHGTEADASTPYIFPNPHLDENLEALLGCAEILDTLRKSPAPKIHYRWWISRQPSYKKAMEGKRACITREIQAAVARLHSHADDESWVVRSAVDHIVLREKTLADKEGREPEFVTPLMLDEVYGFVMAGHETTSTTTLWALKFWTDHPAVQTKLRNTLHATHAQAVTERRMPTVTEIMNATSNASPYLDAVIEETLRFGAIPAIARDATRDTVVLGHDIPKGTTIFMLPNTRSFLSPSFEIDEEKRSDSSRAAKYPNLQETDLDTFNPNRWLVPDPSKADTPIIFDPNAAPQMAFGWGPRGCFGKRLALMELKIVTTLLIWNFELLPVPREISSYECVDCGIARKPKECFVRIRRIEY